MLGMERLRQLSSTLLQVDNLRTNHRGTFVLKDNTFRWLAKLSVDPPPPPGAATPRAVASVSELARDYLVLPCALVRMVVCAAEARQKPRPRLVCDAMGQYGATEGLVCACEARCGARSRSRWACSPLPEHAYCKLNVTSTLASSVACFLTRHCVLARCAARWRIWVSTLQ